MATTQKRGDITKLPVWAQEHIKEITRERETAIRALNKYVDSQTKAPFYIQELECTGEQQGPSSKKRYIQTNQIEVEYAGVHLSVHLRDDAVIDLQWGTGGRLAADDVCFQPRSYQSAYLFTKENMR
jgi:hypothetical protein